MTTTRTASLGPATRPVATPADADATNVAKASGLVQLPVRVRWSGRPKIYDLDRRVDRRRVYEQVLREGTDDDVRRFIDVDQLIDLWGELVLPSHVRTAWARWFSEHRSLDLLSDLQRRIATILANLAEARGFVLAGGGAIIVRGAVGRLTRDLDYFTIDPAEVDQLLPVLEQALLAAGLQVSREQAVPGFARLLVTAGDDEEQTRVDLGTDARLLPPERSEYGNILSAEELAVGKVLAIFGRAEARDFIDLAALEPTWSLQHLCTLATEKDLGFQLDVFRQMLGRFDRLARDEFDIDGDAYQQLRATIDRWGQQVQPLWDSQSGKPE